MKIFKFFPLLIALIALSQKSYCQNTIKFFNIEKINKNNLLCYKVFSRNVQAEIVLFKNSNVLDTIQYTCEKSLLINDTMFYFVELPKSLYFESDSLMIKPTYNFWCSDGSSKQSLEDVSLNSEYRSARKVELNLKTKPEGYTVYLIPKLYWDKNPDILKPSSKQKLDFFRIYEGYTPLTLIVEEYVYVVVFKKGKKGKYFTSICKPKFSNKTENVFLNFEE